MPLFCFLFVLIWSTGFIVGKLIVGLMDPNIYLGLRFLIAGVVFLLLALWQRREFPGPAEIPRHLIAGILMNGLYLGFSYIALSRGLPAGIMALIGALQPALVTCLAFLLIRETTSFKGVLGMCIGIAGGVMVVGPALLQVDGDLQLFTLALACLSILSLSLGAIYQKTSISQADIVSSLALQNLSASLVSVCFVMGLGESLLIVNLKSVLLLLWGAGVLSCCGVFLMVWLLRRIKASQVSILMLLAPPLAAIESYFIFAETLSMAQILGFVVTILGVHLSRSP